MIRGCLAKVTYRTSKDGKSFAMYSHDMRHRYILSRTWNSQQPHLCWLMLNPSTATEEANDPTVERCERRTRNDSRFGGILVLNLYAFRATAPRELWSAADPIGTYNDMTIEANIAENGHVVCAWGTNARAERSSSVRHLLRRLYRDRGVACYHLGLCKTGDPKHPLYIPYATPLTPWTP